MKIRIGFVSNSSSSSFVCKEFDKNTIKDLLNKYINEYALTCEDNLEYYKVEKKDIIKVINNKLNESVDDQHDHLITYVQQEFWGLLNDILDYYKTKREYELSGCVSCEYYKKPFSRKNHRECIHCYNVYLYTEYKQRYNHIRREKRNKFNGFDFRNVTKDIKKYVYNCPTTALKDGRIWVECSYNEYRSLFDTVSDKLFEQWLHKYPNSYVLSFSSDSGNYAEALMRGLTYHLTRYMKRNGVDGYKGENS